MSPLLYCNNDPIPYNPLAHTICCVVVHLNACLLAITAHISASVHHTIVLRPTVIVTWSFVVRNSYKLSFL